MSAISDFNKVWEQKFPGSELPAAWEEDVKTNLAKHKKRVSELQEELEKEQAYVLFLESLLEEVEKKKGDGPSSCVREEAKNGDRAQEESINDIIKDTLEKRSLAHRLSKNVAPEIDPAAAAAVSSSKADLLTVEEKLSSIEKRLTSDLSNAEVPRESSREFVSEDDVGSADENPEDSKDHFVTVIEVNGFEKEKSAGASSHGAGKSTGNEDMKRLKKVPPRPPPKSFKRNTADVNSKGGSRTPLPGSDMSANAAENDHPTKPPGGGLPLSNSSKSNIDRPVIFDSRKSSSSGSSGANTTSSNNGNNVSSFHPSSSNVSEVGNYSNIFPPKPQNIHGGGAVSLVKRFEGCKLPLPSSSSPQNDLDDKIINPPGKSHKVNPILDHPSASNVSSFLPIAPEKDNPNVRSKILDLVNKMESNQNHKPMALSKNIEQLTPKRTSSSFRKHVEPPKYQHQLSSQSADAIVADYIDPCDAEFQAGNDQIYDSPPPEIDTLPKQKDQERKPSRTSTMEEPEKKSISEVVDVENEPMYDTVAPDQEDDYVLLLEETNQTSSSNNSLSKKDSSLESMGIRNNESGVVSMNNDVATIKSQTSVISGHSVATTTSSGTTSDTDGFTGSPLPHDSSDPTGKHPAANYVNIDYFLCKSKRKDSRASGESEEDEPALLRAISYDQDGDAIDPSEGDISESTLEIFDIDSGNPTPPVSGGSGGRGDVKVGQNFSNDALTMTAADQEKYAVFRYMLANIADSESAYVEVLNVMLQYMKALKATLATSKPVLSTDDFNIIFYKIPELFSLHQKFLMGLQQKTPSMTVGKHFENLAREICVYGAFLQNYSRAVDTVRKCSQSNSDFAEISKSIRLRSLNKNQAVSLETLLYSPVSRVQKNIEIIQDLLKCLPESHPDHKSLKSALREFQSFLSEFKMIQPEQLFHGQDRNPRHLVKNSFIVELSEGHRKLRHLFLFNDVLVCAKYKASSKGEKFTFELKWYIPVSECNVVEESTEPRESAPINLVALRSQASTVRDQIKRQTSRDDPKKAKAEKQRKKLAELEAQLVLASPNLVFKVKGNGRAYTFFLSSEYERSQWVDALETLKSGQLSATQLSMHELQSWLTSCRKHLKTNMGSYLLRTGRDENLLVGDFYVLIGQLTGILRPADLYICLEVDSYGHFFRKAKTKMICESTHPNWNQDFVIELEGAQNLRILLYEDHPRQGTLIRAKSTIELSRNWLTSSMNERKIELQDYTLTMSTKFVPSEMTIRRVPTAKPAGLYGAKITQVCKREKRQVPFIMTSCVREVERRGINEVGIYRVSGSASDVSRLKKAFESNAYEAEQLLKDVDIHSVTGALKMYMRELPEALFTDDLYPRFFEAFNLPDPETKRKTLLQLFSTLPPINQHIVTFLLDHMTRINSHENHNKMSLHNMATVFGPTLLRPGARNEGSGNTDLLAAGTVDVMAQAGILYFFLARRANGESLTAPPQ